MSEDKIVLVLKTHGKGSTDVEYRVALVQEMEGMTIDADYPSKDNPLLNRGWLLKAFQGARAFNDAAAAMKETVRLKEEAECMDKETRLVDFRGIFFPSRFTLQDAAELLKAEGWAIDGGELVRPFRLGLKVTDVSYEDNTLRFLCGDFPVNIKDDRIVIRRRGQPVWKIEIRGPVMRTEFRKRILGGGKHQVEREMLQLRFVNDKAEIEQERAHQQREEEKARQARRVQRELKRQREAERQRRKIIEVQADEGTAKCLILSYDYKENVDVAKLNEAIRQVFDGTHCPSVIAEDVLDWDRHTYVVSTFPITREQIAMVCKKYLDRDDDDVDDEDDADSLVP